MTDEEKEALEILKAVGIKCKGICVDEVIINLIEKQQKEIEELKEEQAKRQWVHIKENGEVEPLFYVSKDKIKAKIEEYEDYGITIYYGLRSNGRTFQQAVRMEVKEILQSLLEKE